MSIIELLHKGGPVIWVLAAYSSIGLAIVLERYLLFLRLRRLPRHFASQLNHLLDQPDAEKRVSGLKGPEAHVIQAMVEADRQGVKDLQNVGARVCAQEQQRMEFGLPTLGILGNTAPLLGLLGTITGMIKAFMVIEEAMITTGVGLTVAIPLVILLHFLEGAVERRGQSMQSCSALLLERRSRSCLPEAEQQPQQWEKVTNGL